MKVNPYLIIYRTTLILLIFALMMMVADKNIKIASINTAVIILATYVEHRITKRKREKEAKEEIVRIEFN